MRSLLSPVRFPCRRLRLLSVLLPVFLSVSGVSPARAEDPLAAELTADNWELLVPRGKEVDAIYGDVVLRNDFLTAVIARPNAARPARRSAVVQARDHAASGGRAPVRPGPGARHLAPR